MTDVDAALRTVTRPLDDDDLHLALWCCYEMHHHGFDGVDDDREWDPELLRLRRRLEAVFEEALRSEAHEESLPADPALALRVIGERAAPPLSKTVEELGTLDQLREFAIHRSAYQLKEADGHTFAIPRLRGSGRSAMIEIQADEYGLGRPGEAHSELFAAAMRELGLSDEFGHYVDRLPGTTLATDNLVEMLALNRRLRGALVGHLALFETTSVVPMARYLRAAQRLGGLPAVERFYEVHVEADAHHGHLAIAEMVAGFVADEPALAPDIIFGAAALGRVESRFARHLLTSWRDGQSSLLDEPRAAAVASDREPETRGPADGTLRSVASTARRTRGSAPSVVLRPSA
jgi:hypothetical protein